MFCLVEGSNEVYSCRICQARSTDSAPKKVGYSAAHGYHNLMQHLNGTHIAEWKMYYAEWSSKKGDINNTDPTQTKISFKSIEPSTKATIFFNLLRVFVSFFFKSHFYY